MRSPLILVTALMLAITGVLPATAAAQDVPIPDTGTPIPPIPWQLMSFPGASTPFEPLDYTIQFVPDGTINIHADCNWLIGVWSGGSGALDITLTQTTVAACPADSLEEPFAQALDSSTAYTIDSMSLVISGPVGDMVFVPALPVMG
jgi:heat shock protein HslJ